MINMIHLREPARCRSYHIKTSGYTHIYNPKFWVKLIPKARGTLEERRKLDIMKIEVCNECYFGR